MIFRSLIVALFCIVSVGASAQEVVYFSDSTTNSGKGRKKGRSTEMNIVKISPLAFLAGIVPIYYEREIKDFLSVQVGAGITMKNYIRGWTGNMEMNEPKVTKSTWNGVPQSDESMMEINNFEERTYSTGYHVSIQPRIYFESEGLEGSFIGFAFDKSRYNFSTRKVETGPGVFNVEYTNETFKEYDDFMDFNVHFGSQSLYDRISLEYSASICLRNFKGKRYAFNYGEDGGIIDGSQDVKRVGPVFGLTLKLGYHF